MYIVGGTASDDFPTTPEAYEPTTAGAHDRTHNGGPPENYWDTYAGRLSADGSNLIYGAYLGGSDVEWAVDTHTLALDPQGNAYLNVWTKSSDFPTTPKAFDRSLGGRGDIAIAKFIPPNPALRINWISVWNETVNLVITNLTTSVLYIVQRTDRLAAGTTSGDWWGAPPSWSGALPVRRGELKLTCPPLSKVSPNSEELSA